VKQNLVSGRVRENRRRSKVHMQSICAMEIACTHGPHGAKCRVLLGKYHQRFVSQGIDESLGISEIRY
jgi:hypothetical protein